MNRVVFFYRSSEDLINFDPAITWISCADGYGIKVIREVNEIRMGVCASMCQNGLSNDC